MKKHTHYICVDIDGKFAAACTLKYFGRATCIR